MATFLNEGKYVQLFIQGRRKGPTEFENKTSRLVEYFLGVNYFAQTSILVIFSITNCPEEGNLCSPLSSVPSFLMHRETQMSSCTQQISQSSLDFGQVLRQFVVRLTVYSDGQTCAVLACRFTFCVPVPILLFTQLCYIIVFIPVDLCLSSH